MERQLGRAPVGQHHLQRLSLRESGGQRQPGRGRQLRRQHQRTPGDLLDKPLGSPPTRLNPSFGPILYADNDRVANYNGVTFDLRGRAKGMFFDVSYTRSSSKDDADNVSHGA